jgi:NADH dehydrogenase (ubiquinone) 1 alpha subcomplex subunit 6
MATAISRAAAAAKGALSGQVLGFYRRVCREVPRVVKIYELPLTPAEVRHLVGLHFRGNRAITDPRVVEMLLTKVT